MIVMLSPGHRAGQLRDVMRRNELAHCEELEPMAGCRRFRLS